MPRYIDAEILPKLFSEEYKKTVKLIKDGETHLNNLAEGFTEADEVVRSVPPADVVKIVRCKDCKFYSVNGHCGVLGFCEPDEFCSRGERRKDNAEVH